MAKTTEIILYRGTPLEVEYERTDSSDIIISEVWVKGIEMLALLDDGIISNLRDQIARR